MPINQPLQESKELLKNHSFLDKINVSEYNQSNQILNHLFSKNNLNIPPENLLGSDQDRINHTINENIEKIIAEINKVRETGLCFQYFK